MKITVMLLVILLGFFSLIANAQQPYILAMNVETNPPSADTTEFGVPIIDSTTLFAAVMNVVLASTDSIYQVHVKLGSTLHGTQFLSSSFDYGIDGTFGNTTYAQTGNMIVLGLGTHIGMIHYYAEVQIEKSDHTLEDAVLFSNN